MPAAAARNPFTNSTNTLGADPNAAGQPSSAASPFSNSPANSFFDAPGSSLLDTSKTPQITAPQMGESPELKAMLGGEGFSPATLAQMNAKATQSAADAGQQAMGQEKRALGAAGLGGNAAEVGYKANVAHETGQQEVANQNAVQLQNAQQAMQNMQFAVGQQTSIGQSNLSASQAAAVQNALNLLNTIFSNQNARMNTQTQVAGMA